MQVISILPLKHLSVKNLVLRKVTFEDVNEIFELRSNKETMRFIPRPILENKDQAQEHITMINEKIASNEGVNWAITIQGEDKLIGVIGLYRIKWEHYRAEIGYMLLPQYHNRGIVSECIKIVLDYGFNFMKMHSIEALIAPDNIASAKVLEKNNFVKEAHFKENEFYNGKFLDTVVYSILNNNI